MSDERRFYFGEDAEDYAAELEGQSREAWRVVNSMVELRRAASSERFNVHEVLWARLAVDLASLAALIRQDALTESEDADISAVVYGEAKEE